jgi:hypothetical protein
MIEDLKDEINLIIKKPDKLPLRKKLFLVSFLHFKQDLENQIVTYELSRTKKPAR